MAGRIRETLLRRRQSVAVSTEIAAAPELKEGGDEN